MRFGLATSVEQPALADIATLTEDDLDGRSDEDVAAAVLDRYWQPPTIGPCNVVGHRRDGQEWFPGETPGEKVGIETYRFNLEWPVEGDATWLDCWPAKLNGEAIPYEPPEPFPDLQDGGELVRSNWNRLTARSTARFLHGGGVIVGHATVRRDERPADHACDLRGRCRRQLASRRGLRRQQVDGAHPCADAAPSTGRALLGG